MTTLIQQRNDTDCAICAIAMAMGVTYEQVLDAAGDNYRPERGTASESSILIKLGRKYTYAGGEPIGDMIAMYLPWGMAPAVYRRMIWGRRALVSVPSLNVEGKFHMVYWDGDKVWDPSTRKTYTDYLQLEPREIIIFKDAPCRPPATS